MDFGEVVKKPRPAKTQMAIIPKMQATAPLAVG